MARFVFVVLDGVGVGALPDAAGYGDAGSDTLGNVSRTTPLHLPFLGRMGLGNIIPVIGVPPVTGPLSLVGRLQPLSTGKDTTVGHWEHMGLVTDRPFPTYPNGFPQGIIAAFAERIGRAVLGNRPASGTAIIAELGEEHMATGRPIVYTSADSVFQIAAHIGVVPLDTLYEWCAIARDLLVGDHGVARVIGRPFTGVPGEFVRTKDRRDFSLPPTGPTYLDLLADAGIPVLAVGKIGEVFTGRGISTTLKAASNDENLRLVHDLVNHRSSQATFREGLLMTNLVDFDMVWGHRNDVEGFARGLEAVDSALEILVEALGPEDRLLITADHGVDPTTVSTDHSREYAPLLYYPRPPGAVAAVYEGTFADTGATAFAYLTGRDSTLGGHPLGRLSPARGWRRYTPQQVSGGGSVVGSPGRLGEEEWSAAARWLEEHLGPPPEVAVVLGSGLELVLDAAPALDGSPVAEVPYAATPHWPLGSVAGHPQRLEMRAADGARIAVLHGRAHEYEGHDLSEVQFSVRSLAAWGVSGVVLTSAAGAVTPAVRPGTVVIADEVLDLQYRGAEGEPVRLAATDGDALAAVMVRAGSRLPVIAGIHVSLPGPQYETTAELRALAGMGAVSVSMSPAGELRAALDEGLRVAVLTVVTNSGDTTHEKVLAASRTASLAMSAVVGEILAVWRVPAER